jgi:NAD(P)-dependent dehydrogenase (short-subunit alcohol dehydrogenase family)
MPILEHFSLKGRVALVTGGAGLFGRQIVAALAQAGAQTFVAARRVGPLEELAAAHRAEGYDVTALQFDQGDEESVRALQKEIWNRSGQLDVLVNNAVARPMKNGWHDDIETFAQSMAINATGLFAVTRAFGDAMSGQESGSIINIGSIQGLVAPDPTIYKDTEMNGWYPDYFFHKGGMINFTRFVASYYGAQNIRCNCLCAGGFFNNQPEAFVKQYCERTFLGRMADDTDLMGAVVFLASDASRYVTGTSIPIDGGYTAK